MQSSHPGKTGVATRVFLSSVGDLQREYTPGVAELCKTISANPQLAAELTNIYNRVLVVSDGTATLGLGDIGHMASKPVMEGKVALMSRLAGIDALDLVCSSDHIEGLIQACACNFGAINLEDVAAPRCFGFVENLNSQLDIPVFHDDQDGTAVVVCAALKRALEKTARQIGKCKIVIAGAGASAQAVARLLIVSGIAKTNLYMFDSKGLLSIGRALDENKRYFAHFDRDLTYEQALKNADVFIGLSKGGIIQPEWLLGMNEQPIIFALANPIPEVDPEKVCALRSDVLVATGRSGDLNQVNNVLCFPFLLRAVLDTRAKRINHEMLLACSDALKSISSDALLPNPFDWRLLFTLAAEVALAAMKTGVARVQIEDIEKYKWQLLFDLLCIKNALPDDPFPAELPEVHSLNDAEIVLVYEYTRYESSRRYSFAGMDLSAIRGYFEILCARGSDYIAFACQGKSQRVVGGSDLGLLTAGLYKISESETI